MKKKLFLSGLLYLFLAVAISLSFSLNTYGDEDCDCDKDLDEILLELEQKENLNRKTQTIYPSQGNTDIIAIFSYQNCKYCRSLISNRIPELAKTSGKKIDTRFLPINNKDNYEILFHILKDKKITGKTLPVIVGKKNTLMGQEEIDQKIEALIKQNNNHISLTSPSQQTSQNQIIATFKKFTPILIISAGLIDGINPCAFSVIVFLVTYLSFHGINRKKILYSGIFFSMGVFGFYFLIGIGLFDLINTLGGLHQQFNQIIRISFIIILLILLILSLYDVTILSQRKKPKNMILKLPNSYQKSIHKFIHICSKTKYTIPLSFFLGIAISSVELACTGQIYFPTIAYLIKEKIHLMESILLLGLYNIAFVLPLILVFGLVYLGISTKNIEQFFRNNLLLSKALISGLFAALLIYIAI